MLDAFPNNTAWWLKALNRSTQRCVLHHTTYKDVGMELNVNRLIQYMKMTRGTNLMQQLWFIIINISTCFGHLYAHLQEYKLYVTAYGVQHRKR